MRYTIVNEHSGVNFHDAYVNGVYFRGGDMIWELAGLQTAGYKDCADTGPQEKRIKYCGKDDYFIKNAVMILENACIDSLIAGGRERCDNKGILTDNSALSPHDKHDNFLSEISYRNFSYIHGIKDLPATIEGRYRVSIATTHDIIISFTKSIITWDEFAGADYHRNKVWTNYQPN